MENLENNNAPNAPSIFEPIEETDGLESPVNIQENPQSIESNQIDSQDPNGKRFAYWQSEAAKAKNELERVKEYLPIVKYIEENPHVLSAVEKSLVGEEQVEQPQKIQRPQPPVRPSNYNYADAYNDPESESFKYREAYEIYRDNTINYLTQIEEERTRKFQEMEYQRQQQVAKQQMLSSVGQELMARQFSPVEIQEFITEFSNPSSITLDNLIDLYKLKKGKLQQPQQRTQKYVAQPASVFGGINMPMANEEDSFNDSFAKYSWKNNLNLASRVKK